MRNGEIPTDGKQTCGMKCRRLIVENKIVVFLITCIIVATIVGLLLIIPLSKLVVEKKWNFRLPTNLIPSNYVLEIKPSLIPGDFKFDGKTEITVTCFEVTDEIVLHSSGLEIDEDGVLIKGLNDGELVKVIKTVYYEENELLIFQLLDNLKQNETYRIVINYHGTLKVDNLPGFIVSSYKDTHNVTRYFAATEFKPYYARTALPCFDEPAFKATFDITIVRWKNMTSLSNTNKIKIEPRGNDWEADIYQPSLKISTHTLAFFVGNVVEKSNGKVSVWIKPDADQNDLEYAQLLLDNSVEFIKFYEKLLLADAHPKLDIVPLLNEYHFVRPTWGLLMLDSTISQFKDEFMSAVMRRSAVSILAFSIANQWFGNLVTPKWWSDIWLSEGLSAYIALKGLNSLFPHWTQIDLTTQMLHEGEEQLGSCTYPSTLTITVDSKDDSVIRSYERGKGAAIIRMAHHIMGNRTFWRGLSTYLEKYAYGNVEEKNLWETITKAQYRKSNLVLNLTEIMTPWTHLRGMPIVTAIRDYDRRKVTFSQEPCNVDAEEDETKINLWPIPIFYTTAQNRVGNAEVSTWLKNKSVTVKDMPDENQWIFVNGHSKGYYVVNYDRTNWNLLAAQLLKNPEVFSVDERYKILGDAHILQEMNLITIDTQLDLSLFLGKETKLSLFSYTNMRFITVGCSLMMQSYYEEEWKEYVRYILTPAYKLFERKGGKIDLDIELLTGWTENTALLGIICISNYTTCIDDAIKEYNDWKSKKEEEKREITSRMAMQLCIAIKYGQKDDWEHIYDVFLTSKVGSLFMALSCTEDANLTRKLLYEADLSENHHFFYYVNDFVVIGSVFWTEYFSLIDKHFDEIARDDHTFSRVLYNMKYLMNPMICEQSIILSKKFLRKLSGPKAEELKEDIAYMEKKLPEYKTMKENTETWLKRKPWVPK